MRQLYNLFLRISIPFVILRLLVKSRNLPAYRQRIGERFAMQTPAHKVDIWIHAVSLGEVIAVSPLIETLLQNGFQLMVTSTTPTGSKKITDMFQDRIQHQYLPYDLPGLQRRFLTKIRPSLILLMETEIWPNLVKEAGSLGIKIAIINARLSERSLQGYSKISSLIAPVVQNLEAVLAQSESDAQRFRQLAKHPDKPIVEVLGNIKFDQPLPADKNTQSMVAMQKQWGENRPVLILASTHEDEEKQVLSMIEKLQRVCADLLLLVVPRHPERFELVYEQAKDFGLVTYKRTEPDSIQSDAEVIIIDCVGELMQWYRFAKVAFVGGSLVPVGGHNVLEPAMAGVPVVTGPYLHNFTHITKMLIAKKAMISANNASQLIDSVVTLLGDEQECNRMANAASQVLSDNQGALQRYQNWIKNFLLASEVENT